MLGTDLLWQETLQQAFEVLSAQFSISIPCQRRMRESVLVLIHSVGTALVQASGDLPPVSCQ